MYCSSIPIGGCRSWEVMSAQNLDFDGELTSVVVVLTAVSSGSVSNFGGGGRCVWSVSTVMYGGCSWTAECWWGMRESWCAVCCDLSREYWVVGQVGSLLWVGVCDAGVGAFWLCGLQCVRQCLSPCLRKCERKCEGEGCVLTSVMGNGLRSVLRAPLISLLKSCV